MNDYSYEKFGKVIRNAIKPTGSQELGRDLWPEMILKLRSPVIRVSWFDWVLAVVVVIFCLLIPETVGGLLLHL